MNLVFPKKTTATPAVVCAVISSWPAPARAHLVTTGMGPVYDGIGHLILTPEDLIPAFAVALFTGLHGANYGRSALFVLPISWFLGGCVGILAGIVPHIPLQHLSFIILGLLIAADLRLPLPAVVALVGLVGMSHGYYNGIALRDGPAVMGLFGIVATLFTLVALVAAVVQTLTWMWTKIALRVLGGWITAVGILMIGWTISGQG